MKMTPSDPDIQTIYSRIRSGDLDLQPNFQRGEVWPTQKKRKLIDSILRDWHVPPIHVVVSERGKQEVLDGQQRLAAIRDFIEGRFAVDGEAEPNDLLIQMLNGRYYHDLPDDVRRHFDQFTIRVFRLSDYDPGEPGELFFRLNQTSYLTAAEQRNAFYGPVREQIRSLVEILESSAAVIGFSNRRMAYDDVVARLVCTLESGTLSVKLGASEINTRFRSAEPFPNPDIHLAENTIRFLIHVMQETPYRIRFNKATLFTWLMFAMHFVRADRPTHVLGNFVGDFEQQRSKENHSIQDFRRSQVTHFTATTERSLFRIFSDRSSSRVSDVSSVIFRDLILWIFFTETAEAGVKKLFSAQKTQMLGALRTALHDRRQESTEETLERLTDIGVWGSIR